ncbi:MAG: ATP synthase F1 subunit delta [Bacilli bacterium]|nr:ATP synthase F1 subunit delta [Bacilli bacterium]
MDGVENNYARALYDLVEADKRSDYKEAIENIADVLKNDADAFRLFSSYSISKADINKIADKVFGAYGLPYLADFMKVVIAHHRISSFSLIASEFVSLVNESQGVKEGIAYSAEKLSKEQLEKISEALTNKLGHKVHLKNVVDHHLLGGVKVALDGKVYDGSLRGRLEGMKKQLLSGGNQI